VLCLVYLNVPPLSGRQGLEGMLWHTLLVLFLTLCTPCNPKPQTLVHHWCSPVQLYTCSANPDAVGTPLAHQQCAIGTPQAHHATPHWGYH